jgi:hypothetical protein
MRGAITDMALITFPPAVPGIHPARWGSRSGIQLPGAAKEERSHGKRGEGMPPSSLHHSTMKSPFMEGCTSHWK